MLDHICYRKYLNFKPHPLQKKFFESDTRHIYMAGHRRRSPDEYFDIYRILHEVAKYNKENPREDNNNGGNPCA